MMSYIQINDTILNGKRKKRKGIFTSRGGVVVKE
jgi:hypothetical protein